MTPAFFRIIIIIAITTYSTFFTWGQEEQNISSLLKTEDSLMSPEQEKELLNTKKIITSPIRPNLFWEIRGGFFSPWQSIHTDDFKSGYTIGASATLSQEKSTVQFSIDSTYLGTPSEYNKNTLALYMIGASYLFTYERLSAGGGLSLANASPINNILLAQGTISYSCTPHFLLNLDIYFPLGNNNNMIMPCIRGVYRF